MVKSNHLWFAFNNINNNVIINIWTTPLKVEKTKPKGHQRPENGKDLLYLDENKASLANFLCHHNELNKELVLSGGFSNPKTVWSSTDRDVSSLSSQRGSHPYPPTCPRCHVFRISAGQCYFPRQRYFGQHVCMKRVHELPLNKVRASLLAFHALTWSETTNKLAILANNQLGMNTVCQVPTVPSTCWRRPHSWWSAFWCWSICLHRSTK